MGKMKCPPIQAGGKLTQSPSKTGSLSAAKKPVCSGSAKSKESGPKERDTVSKAKAVGVKVVADAASLLDDDREENEDEGVGEEEDEDVVELVDVNAALVKCRAPPTILLEEDWVNLHNLSGTGVNPKRFSNVFKSADDMAKLFGKRSGKRGRNGYKWQDCLKAKVMERVLELHPVIYQHDPEQMPPVLKVKFAEGIQHEFVHGEGSVNWAAFAQEVNQRQRKMRVDTREKLQYCKDKGVTRVSKDEIYKLKLETSVGDPVANAKRVRNPRIISNVYRV